ncbi:unnamed protein product, partial [Discosporangium mesarthrocarpum]
MAVSTRDALHVPQAVDVERFAEARIHDLELLDAAITAIGIPTGKNSGKNGLHGQVTPSKTTSTTLSPPQVDVLPRHLRRRTTSHKSRRMPVALRNRKRSSSGRTSADGAKVVAPGAEAGEGMGEGTNRQPLRCRKHRRRPRDMLSERNPHVQVAKGSGGTRSRWLETHLWHTKRMVMKEKWGFVLPIKSNR